MPVLTPPPSAGALFADVPTPDPRTLDDAARPFALAVADRYAVKRLVGRGGMGVVYLARDRRLDRLVALKTLLPALAEDATVRERFVRETRTAGGLSHPNIVPVHEAGEAGGHVFFAMGYVDGESLAARVRAEGRLAPAVVARHLRDVTAALAHAHARGVVHRDVKAENILVERGSGRALVTDFGIARIASAAPLTATGQLLGTVHYVSPEQVAGDAVDARSDLYSLGVVGYLALAGRFPFDGDVASAVLVAHVTRPAPALRAVAPDVPAALAAVVDRCLAKAPDDRYASAEALLAALDAATEALGRPEAPPAPARPAPARPAPAPPVAAPRSLAPLVSDTEAQAVWNRAAELQAATGVRPRPPAVPRPRDPAADARRRTGLDVAAVRAAGVEAGIAPRYVDHALAERGLSPRGEVLSAGRRRGSVPAWVGRVQWGALLAGAPLEITYAADAPGVLAPRDVDRLVNVLRDGTGTLGAVEPLDPSVSGAGVRWRAGWAGHRLTATLAPAADGRTAVRVTQRMGRAAAGLSAASLAVVGGVVGPAVGVVLDVVMSQPVPSWGLWLPSAAISAFAAAGGVAAGLLSLPLARALVRRAHRYHAARLRTLGELLALRAGGEDGR